MEKKASVERGRDWRGKTVSTRRALQLVRWRGGAGGRTLCASEDLLRRWVPFFSFSLSLSRRVSNRFGMLAFIVATECGRGRLAVAASWESGCGDSADLEAVDDEDDANEAGWRGEAEE